LSAPEQDETPSPGRPPPSPGGPPRERSIGRVYLVGAGPGDPGLLTARALELIAQADVILYDRLIPARALDGAREDAELLYVGKEGGGDAVPQERTEALLVARAKEGGRVVRLKGGDPFVFGRGGEEAMALRAAGIPYEIVPGVTAGVAGAAYAGIPVTHRAVASAVALVTGHEDPGKPEKALDWEGLAAFPGTLVLYMGIRRLPEIASSLIAAGRRPVEPVAVIERGTMPGQRVIEGTLETIAARAEEAGVRPPAITVIGDVVDLAEKLAWMSPGPLSGKTVAVTRARAQASALARRLSELGADVIEAPAIRIEPLRGEPMDLTPYDLICLTSPNGVRALFDRLRQAPKGPRDARALANATVAAIGPGTARALREHGIEPDVIPGRFVAEALVEALAKVPIHRALVARAQEAREVLPAALRARGAEVDVLPLYKTVAEPLSDRALTAAQAADYITFTSSSTVRFFLQAAGIEASADSTAKPTSAGPHLSPATRVLSIGPITSETLRKHGIEPNVEAERHDIDGVIDALVTDALAHAN
jgi:uroporphyrinogen III methyltransferase / synthase